MTKLVDGRIEGYLKLSKTERLKTLVQEADAVAAMLGRPLWGSPEWEDRLQVRLDRIRDLTDLTTRKGTTFARDARRQYDPDMVPVVR